jgi:putative FmdB family regulatory protein
MPLYEYRCPKCRTTFELLQPMSASDAATCPQGHDGAQRVVSLVASRVYGENGGSMMESMGGGGGCACGGGGCGCGH